MDDAGGGRRGTRAAVSGELWDVLATDCPRNNHQAPAPDVRVGDADRDAAAAALGEHFAQGRLTLDELNARLDAALTATTHGDLSQAARDVPDLTVLSARVSLPRGKRAIPRKASSNSAASGPV